MPATTQINAFTRYAVVIATTVITMLGLQTKGIYLDQVKAAIEALGSAASSIVTAVSAITVLIATYKGFNAASPTNQSIALEKTGAIVVTTKEIAAATPDSPNVISHDDVQILPKAA